MDEYVYICKCHSYEHQIGFSHDTEDKTMYVSPHLCTNYGFWRRLWVGLRYTFGYKSRYGAWDEVIFEENDIIGLRDYLNQIIKNEYNGNRKDGQRQVVGGEFIAERTT